MAKAMTTNKAKKRGSTQRQGTKKTDAEQPEAEMSSVEPVAESQTEASAKETEETNPLQPEEEIISQLDGVALPAASGKAGVLGGSKDRGVKPEDKLALPAGRHFTYERVHSLNPKSFYCAMRWEYRVQGKSPEEGKRWWANKKILVTNPANGNQVVVRAVDYGPHENTGLTISLSPAALEALALELGGEVKIAFADQKALLGVVNQ